MLKHVIALILFSLLVVIGMPYLQQGLALLLTTHGWISDTLSDVFSGGQAGSILKSMIAMLCIPVLIGLIPTIIYWLVKRTWFPYFGELIWVVWLVQLGVLAMSYKDTIISAAS